jgi:ATP-dependent helicase/nuclease subunit A
VVCAYDGERKRPDGCWYDLVLNTLKDVAVREPAEDGDGELLRYRKPESAGTTALAMPQTAAAVPTPAWFSGEMTTELPALVPLSPSTAYDESTMVRSRGGGADRKSALARGTHMHRLLQALPDLPADARLDAARRYLEKAKDVAAEEREGMIAQVQRLLDDPRFAELFQAGSRAEVSIVGRLAHQGRTIAVAGQVDRLVVTDTAVLIADYTTHRPAPSRIDEVPRAYVRQLALYRAVLGELYPDRTIRAALIWTETLDLMEISPALMDQELTALTLP